MEKNMEEPSKQHGVTMAKTWKNHGKNMEQTWTKPRSGETSVFHVFFFGASRAMGSLVPLLRRPVSFVASACVVQGSGVMDGMVHG